MAWREERRVRAATTKLLTAKADVETPNPRPRLQLSGDGGGRPRLLTTNFDTVFERAPIIYFLGIAPGRYQAILPTFISGWDGAALKARVAFGPPDLDTLAPPETALERRYALRTVKQRLHQASFREAVISAYNGRCALSGLPESVLLDAAHIMAGKGERFGQPLMPTGIALSTRRH